MVLSAFGRFGVVCGAVIGGASFAFSQMGGNPIGGKILDKKFVENKGQWDSDALFVSRQPGLDYWITKDGIKVDLYKYVSAKGGSATENDTSHNMTREGSIINFKFNGASNGAQPFGIQPSDSKIGFFIGDSKNHAENVNVYGEATVRNLMPGVNLRNYYDGKGSRYDIVVKPGVDARQVSFDVLGAQNVRLVNGELVIDTPVGQLRQGGLYAYQPVGNFQRKVSVKFKMTGPHTVGFDIGEYDSRLPLVIDPLVYGTYIGSTATFFSSGYEKVNGIHADNQGNVFVTGETDSITFPITDGPYGFALAGAMDSFLIRLQGDAYDTTYVAYVGGTDFDSGSKIAYEDESGDLWIVGETDSTDFPGVTGGSVSSGLQDIFLSKFSVSETGVITPVESIYYTNTGQLTNHNLDIAINADGSFYLSGWSLTASGAFTPYIAGAPGGGFDGFITKFTSAGVVTWERYVGSTISDSIGRIAVDGLGNVLMVGSFLFFGTEDTSTDLSPTFTTTAGVYPEGRFIRNGDYFLVKIDPSGNTLFASLLGGANLETVYGAAFDDIGNIYIVGSTDSFDFPRNEGAFDETPAGSITATKIKFDGSEILYSTGLNTTGNATATAVAVDKNGNLVIAGIAGWSISPAATGVAAVAAIPSSIPIVGGLDGAYTDGANATFSNGFPPLGGCPPTTDGFIIFLNASGTNIIYSDYIGQNTDDTVTDIHLDSTGATWIAGNVTIVICNTVPPTIKPAPHGIAPYITGNAAKVAAGGDDGFLVKLRVGQPIVNSVTIAPLTIGAGLGASSLATITLRDPAPIGGVSVTATLSNSAATSFTAGAGNITTSLFIPQGTTTITKQIFSLPITTIQTSDLRVSLENDFVQARLTVKPWLDSFSAAPATLVGGNGLTLTAVLPQAAISPVTIALSTDRPDIITLPAPANLVIPTGATQGSITVQTKGVVTSQSGIVSASLLGVTKNSNVTLIPSTVSSLTFNPPTVNGGSNSTGTVTFNGKVGAARTVDLTFVAGNAGALINGNPLPAQVIVATQTSSVTFTVTSPAILTSGFVTMNASDGTTNANGTLFIDNIDISDLLITPSQDVLGGTLLRGQVVLSKPAGPGGFTVDLASSNTTAATVAVATITVPEGGTTSALFNIPTNVVITDMTTDITAAKSGFTTITKTVNVRSNQLSLALVPTTVVGGVNSVGIITLTNPAPVGGLLITLTSGNPSAATVPANVTVLAGATTATFTVTTLLTNTGSVVGITAAASAGVTDTENLTILAQTMTLSLAPTSVIGGSQNSTGTIVLNGAAPVGGVIVTLSSSNPAFGSVPANVTVAAGASSVNFTVTTSGTAVDTAATITATTPVGVTDSKILTIKTPSITNLVLTPSSLIGPGSVDGTVTINVAAPVGGVVVVLNHNGGAGVTAPPTVTILAGETSVDFTILTAAVAIDKIVTVTATLGTSSDSASFEVKVPRIESIVFSPPKVQGGGLAIGTITLSSIAPTGGLIINVASLNPTFATILGPTMLTIPAGSRTAIFTVESVRVSRLIAVQFHASITASTASLSGFLWIKP